MSAVTAQISDFVELDGTTYSIAGVDGGPLFDPAAHDIQPTAISTACWRGYVCWYGVETGELRLTKLVLGIASKVAGQPVEPGRSLLGSVAVPTDSPVGGGLEIDGIGLLVPFTGSLLLGEGFVRSTYVHMGFHPAWRFESVVELLLTDGTLTGRHDRSAEFAAIRQRIQSGETPDPDGPPGGPGWIRRTFTRGYRRSVPD